MQKFLPAEVPAAGGNTAARGNADMFRQFSRRATGNIAKKKASCEPLWARNSNRILLFIFRKMTRFRKKGGIYDSPPDRHAPNSSPASKMSSTIFVTFSTSSWASLFRLLQVGFEFSRKYLSCVQTPRPRDTPFHAGVTLAIFIYRSFHTPEPRNPPKVSKRTSRASPPGVKKVSKKSPDTDFVVFLTLFRVISLSFFSLVFWISLVNSKRGISLVFSQYFPRMLRAR